MIDEIKATKPKKDVKPKKKRNPKGSNPVGRPKKILTEDQKKAVILGLSLGCTISEVVANTGVSETVLRARFGGVIKTGMDSFNCSLKKELAKSAFSVNVTMLIWLGKQYLGQKDKMIKEISGPDGKPIQHINTGMSAKDAAALYSQMINDNE